MSSSFSASVSAPWRAWSRWLADVPIADPVDRRNAPMLQWVLLMLGTLPPLSWLYRIVLSDLPWRPGEATSLTMSLALSALALFSLALIRQGCLQWAVRQLLVTAALLMFLSYLDSGMAANRFEQTMQMIWIVMAGLMVGRRALWLMYGWLVLAFGAGTLVDIAGAKAGAPADLLIDALVSALVFLFVSIVVDRSTTAWRESLNVALLRSAELVAANAQLQAEIVERARIREQLIHAQKVEAVGRLASGVAHDFNHLLTLILGYAARGQGTHDSGELKQALAGVDRAARRAAAVARKLLSFSRRDETHPEVFDACEVLRDMKGMFAQLFDPTVALVFDLGDAPMPVRLDRAQFELVVLNIAANANQAMPEGGRFRIAVMQPDASSVDIAFGDSGHGMSADVQAQIFEPFFTTRAPGQGSGIGLAVAVGVIAEAAGRLTVDSAPGQGAVFHLRLPLALVADVDRK